MHYAAKIFEKLTSALQAQHGHGVYWSPICLSIGIGYYFSQPTEPHILKFCLFALSAVLFGGLGLVFKRSIGPLFMAFAFVAVGLLLAAWKTHYVAAPKLEFRYYGPISGRLIALDRSNSDAVRLTLDQVTLGNVPVAKTPAKVRISLHGFQPISHFTPGDIINTTGHLSPPSGPAEPGGYDFQRHAWFMELGAVGYTRTPALRFAQHDPEDFSAMLFSLRMKMSRIIRKALPNEVGAFAAALITGDRSEVSQDDLNALRASNLAHLLAISGLHMGLLTALIFSACRSALALNPYCALHWPVKKIAATAAIFAGLFYLLLSGGNIATQRAFVMIAVMFCAILLDRKALSLRAVALAALIVLTLYPNALMGPGFHMSFSATVALIVIFGYLQRVSNFRKYRILNTVTSLVLSSFIAGMATAPFSAAHFNHISYLSLPANLASVPLMGFIIMPAAIIAILLMPFGLEHIPLTVMGWGLEWTLGVAHTVSSTDGAVGAVISPSPLVLPSIALGALWIILWQGHLKWAGGIPVLFAFALWSQAERPDLLISDRGTLMGLMTPSGRALSKPKGDGFVAQVWLENDGTDLEQIEAAGLQGLQRGRPFYRAKLGPWTVLMLSGKRALSQIKDCDGADILISNQPKTVARFKGKPCLTYDASDLKTLGSLSMQLDPSTHDLMITSAAWVSGHRLWNKQLKSHNPLRTPITLSGYEKSVE